jgi:digeranylgeranylglycerophospholipid reductase
VPAALPPDETVKQNVVLVGDAARQVNPFTGAGVANAFIAGKIAGEICADVACRNQSRENLKKYEKLWRESLDKKLRRSNKLKNRILLKDRNIERFCILLNILPNFIIRRLAKGLHY